MGNTKLPREYEYFQRYLYDGVSGVARRPLWGLVGQLKNFMIELGRDFCIVGSEYLFQGIMAKIGKMARLDDL